MTKKDAADMVFILQNVYVAYALTRPIFPPEIGIDASQFDVVVAGAEWMASDLKYILTPEHRQFYTNLLQDVIALEEDSQLINDMLDVSSGRYYDLFRRALQRMAEIWQE